MIDKKNFKSFGLVMIMISLAFILSGCPPPTTNVNLTLEYESLDDNIIDPPSSVTTPSLGTHVYNQEERIMLSENPASGFKVNSFFVYDSSNVLIKEVDSPYQLNMDQDYRVVADIVCDVDDVCMNDYICVNQECVLEEESSINKKNDNLYSVKETFLVSGSDWRNVLQILPMAVWTQQQEESGECQRGHHLPENVCVYPKLIWHEEGSHSDTIYDVDSIHHFFKQYEPSKISYFGELPQELLSALDEFNVEPMLDFLDYWETFSDMVYVEEDYALALLASTYASLINAPLIIENHNDDIDFSEKNVICVGLNLENCDETHTKEDLELIYLEKTNTNKLVLVNPDDINNKVNSVTGIPLEKTSGFFKDLFSKLSLSSSYISSAKHQLLISSTYTEYGEVNSFITEKINNFNNDIDYLTILSSPNMIPFARNDSNVAREGWPFDYGEGKWTQVDSSLYADLTNDYYQDIAIGRIFSFSISDVSSYVARIVFYNHIDSPNDFLTLTSFKDSASIHRSLFIESILADAGYEKISAYSDYGDNYPRGFDYELFLNKNLIYFSGHSNVGGYDGFQTSNFRRNNAWLNQTIIANAGCYTCSFDTVIMNNNPEVLFCSEMIRRGGLAYVGLTDSGFGTIPNFVYYLAQNKDLGSAFKKLMNKEYAYISRKHTPYLTLIGDPTFNPGFISSNDEGFLKVEQSDFSEANSGNWIKHVNVTLYSVPIVTKENLKFGYGSDYENLTSTPFFGGDNTLSSYFFTRSGNENIINDLKITFDFYNVEQLSLLSINNALMIIGDEIVDITHHLSYNPDNPFTRPYLVFQNTNEEDVTYMYIDLNIPGMPSYMFDENTAYTPEIRFEIELEFS